MRFHLSAASHASLWWMVHPGAVKNEFLLPWTRLPVGCRRDPYRCRVVRINIVCSCSCTATTAAALDKIRPDTFARHHYSLVSQYTGGGRCERRILRQLTVYCLHGRLPPYWRRWRNKRKKTGGIKNKRKDKRIART